MTSWRVAGFMTPAKLRIKPILLSKEGFVDEAQAALLRVEPTSEAIQKTVDSPGWLPAVNVLFGAGGVRVIRRNCLGEERYRSSTSLPISMTLE